MDGEAFRLMSHGYNGGHQAASDHPSAGGAPGVQDHRGATALGHGSMSTGSRDEPQV